MPNKKGIGQCGEDIACEFLLNNGFIIMERNFTTKLGEIDIIAKRDNYIVFIEVKARRSKNFGYPREAVDFHKQNKLKMIANIFLSRNKFLNSYCRFDVVEIFLDNSLNPLSISLIDNAFN